MKVVKYELYTGLKRTYKIALLSDTHGKFDKHIVPALKENKPDIICIVGDLINTPLNESMQVTTFLKECIDVAPTFLSLGNHDYLISVDDIKKIKSMGICVLNDTYVRFNDEIIIGGMTSYFYHKCEKHDPKIPMVLYPELKWLDNFEQQKGYKILMDHHPDNYDRYTAHRKIDLILSGHVHGGQVRLFGKGVYGRSQGFFPKYDGGIYDNKMIVGRGLSNTMPIPRLWNPTELVFVELKIRENIS